MSDSEDSDIVDPRGLEEIQEEIEKYKRNPDTASMFVSGWDDADQDVEVIKDPKDNPIDHILWAAENGKVETIRELLSTQPGLVNAKDDDGYTPLHRAAYSNHVAAISYLLSKGANVHAKTEMGWTPLHSACNWNNYLAVARLLAASSDINALSDGGQSPVHLAASISQCKATLLVLFLKNEILFTVDKQNNSGETAKQLARRQGIYSPLFEMVVPSVSYIKSVSFTNNPFMNEK